MMYIIGLGHTLKDLSLNALDALKNSNEVYLESYTSLSNFKIAELESLISKKVQILNRKGVEEEKSFLKENTSLLVYGDPLSATTHLEILQEAEKKNIKVEIIHAPSIMTTIAETGLQLYKFGKTASIPFWTESYKPESFFDYLEQNQSIDAHTLCLLDLDPENESFLSISDAISRILEISKSRKSNISEKTKFIGCSRLGMKDALISYGNQAELSKINFGKAPFCLILPGKLNFIEDDIIAKY